jgi:K319-like protein/parallel beta helix pectate lyase-like protein/uncharacterized protein DUF1565
LPSSFHLRIAIFLVLTILLAVIPVAAQSRTLYLPALRPAGPEEINIALVNPTSDDATVTLTARAYDGGVIAGTGVTNPVTVVLPEGQISRRASDIFGSGIYNQSGWVEVSSSLPAVKAFALVFNGALSSLEGSQFARGPSNRIVFPKVTGSAESPTRLSLVNTAATAVQITMTVYENSGNVAGTWSSQLPARSGLHSNVRDLVPLADNFDGYAVVEARAGFNNSSSALVGLEAYAERSDIALVSALSISDQLNNGFFAQISNRDGFKSTLTLVNPSSEIQVMQITAGALTVNGNSTGPVVVERVLSRNERLEENVASLFGFSSQDQIEGFVRFDSPVDGPGVLSSMRYGTTDGVTLSTLAAQPDGYWDLYFPRVAEQGVYYTGLSILNPNNVYADVTFDLFNDSGTPVASRTMRLMPGERRSGLLPTFFSIPLDQFSGYVRVAGSQPILGQEFMGTTSTDASLASVTPELVGPVAADVQIAAPMPWINSLTPDHSELRDQRVDVQIAGSGFTGNSIVNYDGVSIRSTLVSPALIAVTLLYPQLDLGVHSLEVVNPGIEDRRSNAVTFTVQPNTINEAPYVDAGPDQTATLPAAVNLDGVATDDQLPTGSSVTTTWSMYSGPGTVTFGDVNALSTTASFSSAGTYVLRLTATDTALSSSDDVIITISAKNVAPIVNSGVDQSITLPASANLTGLIGDDGLPVGATITTTWSMLSGPGSVIFGDIHSLNTTASFSVAGTYALRLTADDTAAFNYDDMIVTVNAPNLAPVVSAGPDQSITLPNSAILMGTATDDGLPQGILTTTWSKSSGPGTVTFVNPVSLSTSAGFSDPGTYVLQLTATDSLLSTSSIVTITVAAPIVVPAGTYYVSTTGNDANPGTPTSPWRTIQKAANTLAAGQTVIVNAGTYGERVVVSKSGSSGSLLTFQAQGTVIMQGFNVQASYVKISGFEITNVPGNDLFNRAASSGVYLSGSNNEITGTYIHEANAAGIFMTTGTTANTLNSNRIVSAVEAGIYVQGTNHLVISNDISHTVQTHPGMINSADADGIRFFGSGSTFRKNYIHDVTLADAGNANPHIDAFQTWGPCSNMIIEQNTILQMESPDQGIIIEGLTQPVGNITVRNNVIMTNGTGYAPSVMAGDVGLVTNVTIVNNTMVALNGPSEYAIWLFKNLQGAVVKNNAIYDHGKSSDPYIRIDSGATGLDIGSNSISKSDNVAPSGGAFPGDLWMVQPQFMRFSSRDFHLSSTSPLINAGASVSVTNDMDGVARPLGGAIDIGAFEKQ